MISDDHSVTLSQVLEQNQLVPTFPSLVWLRALDRSSIKASRSPTLKPTPRRRKSPSRSCGCRDLEVWVLGPQLLAHHLSCRYVSCPDSLSTRMAMDKFFSSGEPASAGMAFSSRPSHSRPRSTTLAPFSCLLSNQTQTRTEHLDQVGVRVQPSGVKLTLRSCKSVGSHADDVL